MTCDFIAHPLKSGRSADVSILGVASTGMAAGLDANCHRSGVAEGLSSTRMS